MDFLPAVEPLLPATDRCWQLAFVDGKLLLPDGEAAALAPLAGTPWPVAPLACHYLGRLHDLDAWVSRLAAVPPGWQAVPLRAAMMQFPAPLLGLASRAAQVLEWDRAHRFCGVCGTATNLQPGERARCCPACRHCVYPRLSPAMMTLVWRRDRGRAELLLARAPGGRCPG